MATPEANLSFHQACAKNRALRTVQLQQVARMQAEGQNPG